jgi:hypothetical protein
MNFKAAERVVTEGFFFAEVPFNAHLSLIEGLCAISGLRLDVISDEIVDSVATIKKFPRSMTQAYGLSEFPLHTDRAHDLVPPRFVLLSRAAGSATALTRVCRTGDLPIDEHDWPALRRDVWRVRYGRRRFLTSVCNDTLVTGQTIVRYDPCCMQAASSNARSPLIMQDAVTYATTSDFELVPAMTLIIDNWKCLHGRSAVFDANKRRQIHRTLIGATL